jgi:N-acetylneuraminic acid mutarotase
MCPAVRVDRFPTRILSAGLIAIGLMLEGCGERQESPLGPGTTVTAGTTGSAVDPADKEGNAVDLGQPLVSGHSALSLSASAVGTPVTSIPFDPEPGPFAHSVPACDDCVQEGLPIGFSFSFFGNTYTSFNISSNGFIGFSPGTWHGCCSGYPIPSADGLNNLIAAAWTDLYPLGGGGVFYETRGRAPDRYLVVAYEHLPWYRDFGTNAVTTQIILYEGTNVIEIHTTNQSAGHIYTQGVEDASGTHAAFVAGRVAANYGLTNDAVRFTLGNFWNARAPLPSARRALAVGAANGLVFAIGGLNSAGSAISSVMGYNPSTNSWSSKAALPASRSTGNGAATINGTIYVAGGQDAGGGLTRTLFAYNASTNNWTTRANMPVASGCGGSAVIGGKLYVFGGCTSTSTGGQTAAKLLQRYDPSTNSWAPLPSAPAMHFQPAVGAISGKLYVAGGNNGSGTAVGRLDVYDPGTNSWSTKAMMPTARVAAGAAVMGGKLHVIGGRNGGTYLNAVESYDPMTNTWTPRAALPTARASLGAGVTNALIYAIGGRNGSGVLAANERYTP